MIPHGLIPLHPKLVHFPIALFITALMFEGVHLVLKRDVWHHSALLLYAAAALMTPLVVQTGMWEVDRLGLHHPVLDSHRRLALWTMWFSLASLPVLWWLRARRPQWLKPVVVCCLIVAAVCVTLAGHYGGRMVYEYGVGMESF